MKTVNTVTLSNGENVIFVESKYTNDFNQIENTEFFTATKKSTKSYCYSCTICIYCEASFYSSSFLKNVSLHLPGIDNDPKLKLYVELVSHFFMKVYGSELTKVFISHEHSKKSGKCHLVICVFFKDCFNKKISPFIFYFANNALNAAKERQVRLLLMKLKSKYSSAIFQFIQNSKLMGEHKQEAMFLLEEKEETKDKEFIDINNQNENENANENQNENETEDDNLFQSPLTTNNNFNPFSDNNFSIFLSPHPDENELKEKEKNQELFKHLLIEKWYNHYYKPKGLRRRKSLLLFTSIVNKLNSLLGFSKGLVEGENNYVILKEQFCNINGIENKAPKLLILYEMDVSTLKYHQIWSNILSGQKVVALNESSCGLFCWDFQTPCIIITSNILLVKELLCDEQLKEYLICQEITENDEDINEQNKSENVEIDFSSKVFQELINCDIKNNPFFLGKKIKKN